VHDLLHEAQSDSNRAYMLGIRRHLHQWPELSYNEHNTSAYIQRSLRELGVAYDIIAGTGISAFLGSTHGPQIALRADMDALPIEEATEWEEGEVDFGSKVPGVMHACGHDAHVSMLLGGIRLLLSRRHDWESKGGVTFIFQPAEEGKGGAKRIISEGGLRGAQAVSGLHVWPGASSGTITTRPGVLMAASDRFAFTVVGKGGHGAIPHLAQDPVVAASAIVMALQPLVSRETSPTDGAVVTVSRFNTGEGASNVIPDQVEIQGTLRALTPETFERLHRRLEQVVSQTAATFGCNTSAVQWSPTPYPPTINDAGMVQMVLDVGQQLLDSHEACQATRTCSDATMPVGPVEVIGQPSMAAEDFSFYGQRVPSVFTFLGIGDSKLGTDVSLHNSHFKMDERQMALGAALHAATALEFLNRHEQGFNTVKTDEL